VSFDRADVELALGGGVLGDVGQPQPVRAVGLEAMAQPALLVDDGAQVVVDGRTGSFAVAAALARERREPAHLQADPPCGPLGHGLAGVAGLVDQEAIAELGVLAMSIEQGVGAMRADELGVADGLGQPAVIGLAGDLQDPARHRDGHPVGGQLADERVHHFPGRFA